MATNTYEHNEAFFQALIEHSTNALVLLQPDGCITYASPATEGYTGYTCKELVERNSFTLIHPLDLAMVQSALATVLAIPDRTETIEYRFLCKDGDHGWFRGTFTNMLTRPPVCAILSTLYDISEQKRTEERLRRNKESSQTLLAREQAVLRQEEVARRHLNDLFMQAPAMVCVLRGPEHRLELVNDAFRQLYPRREFVLEKTVRENWPDLEDQDFFEELDRVYQSGRAYAANEKLALIDREDSGIRDEGYFNIVYQPIFDERGSVESIIVYIMEVTEQVLARQRIQESEARLRRLIDANIVGVTFCTLEGRINEANDVFLRMIGYTREDLRAGRIDWARMTPPEYEEIDAQAISDLRARGAIPHPYEKAYRRKDGTLLPVVVTAAALDEANPNECIAFILDNSMQKELDQRKDDFISMTSHELKTPVTSIKGLTQVLLKRFEQRDEPDIKRMLLIMDVQLNKLTKLIGDLLDISKAQGGQLIMEQKPFDLDTLVCETIEHMQTTMATQHIKLVGKANATIMGDRDRIGQVIVNLLSNAIKYSSRNSPIVVKVFREGQQAVTQIQDFGIGIDAGYQDKLFNQFYRVTDPREPYPGLGIGLYLSRQIIERHSGRIWLQSRKGEGSIFAFSLPVV
ncbi:sensor histidine kinase [Dictyobacter aurantiacus]|uniref:histidine kinase n=1 Tax=Dictyobacter aurantiacus TaxID=1936993 RepID=A0A401ZLF2_9CHLR|nr:PAS domain S-box protein [Dictyobacter aurantiacus]GCE07644.1 hypothetical protein KDAU_49730 [Dictyobacter aurantiacus]